MVTSDDSLCNSVWESFIVLSGGRVLLCCIERHFQVIKNLQICVRSNCSLWCMKLYWMTSLRTLERPFMVKHFSVRGDRLRVFKSSFCLMLDDLCELFLCILVLSDACTTYILHILAASHSVISVCLVYIITLELLAGHFKHQFNIFNSSFQNSFISSVKSYYNLCMSTISPLIYLPESFKKQELVCCLFKTVIQN